MKIQRGMAFIEQMLQERLWFIKQMSKFDESMLNLTTQLYHWTGVQELSQLDKPKIENAVRDIKQIIGECYEYFQRINTSILAIDRRYVHSNQWKQAVERDFEEHKLLQIQLNYNLIEGSSNLYGYLRKKNQIITKLQENSEHMTNDKAKKQIIDGDKIDYILNDEQIQKLIEFLETFSEELSSNVPLQLRVLCHLWMEDMIKTQNQYQKNIMLYNQFAAQFSAKYDFVITFVEKTQYNLKIIRNDTLNSQRILQRIAMPQLQINQNISYTVQAWQKLLKCKNCLAKLQEEIIEIYQTRSPISFLRISEHDPQQQDEEDDAYRPVGEFDGALKLSIFSVHLLHHVLQSETKSLSAQLEDITIETEGITLIYDRVKEILIADKKLRKAQNLFISVANLMIRQEQILQDAQPFDELSIPTLNQLVEQGMEFYGFQVKLQKYVNWLSYYLNMANQIQTHLPLIGEFVVMLEKFIQKSNLLLEQAIRKVNFLHAEVYETIIQKRLKTFISINKQANTQKNLQLKYLLQRFLQSQRILTMNSFKF